MAKMLLTRNKTKSILTRENAIVHSRIAHSAPSVLMAN